MHAPRIDRRWLAVVPSTLILGWVFTRIGLPAGWVIASILVAATAAVATGRSITLSGRASRAARAVIAILAAAPLTATPATQLVNYLIPGLVVSAATIGIGVTGGLLLHHAHREISRSTGVLSMLAGGASVMPFLARDMGADYRYVTLTQYLRLLAVMLSLPLAAMLIGFDTHPTADTATDFSWIGLLVLLIIMAVGQPVGTRLHIPAPSILGPMLLTVLAHTLLDDRLTLTLPGAVTAVAFMAIGWMAGGALSVPALKSFARTLPATLLFITALIAGCAATALLLTWWLDIPYLDAYLATSPGGLETVLIIADEADSGPVVAAVQIIRLIGVLILASWMPQVLHRIARVRHRD
ncbi:AbrB family transcriptional regulator [Corynebacterium sp. CCM 9185]|uniref:AbrB family transcriptional regulator n=4 Tax=Corynebacterium marambiense TaxID=2765364 RepID=A0ABS0VWK7_9CORY|nr:AbrB family transcriptional regulator [Corynebacterium marambiense]MCK7662568.1 AbrB family transcriptional regulator [Corynebacterium marambiense]